MSKHNDKKIWMLRKDGESNGYVKTVSDKTLHVYYYSDMKNPNGIVEFDINRTDARALARRILECLKETI
jgi:hypothetical protein